MAFNRELSQFAAYLDLDAGGKYIGITPAESTTNVGIGVTNPGSKLSVVGDANITGVVTATQFYGNLDYSYILNATAGVRTEFSVVDNGGDGSLSYDSQTGIISYVGPSASEARAHFSATSTDLGSFEYNAESGVFAYAGVTTANIRDQFSSSSADIGSLSYNSATGEFSLSGVTTASIRNQFTGGTGVSISDGEVSIGQPVGTSDAVTFASVNSTGIVTATEFVTGASGEAIGINTNTISGPSTLILDPSAVGDDTGLVVIKGDLQVDGTQTIINSTTVTVNDKNIQIADGAANDAAADGAGITVNSGDGNKTFQFNDATDAFKANISLDVASGEVYKINGTEVLSSDTLGSGVVNSSLTSVGTLGQLSVSGVTTSSGGFVGNLTGDVTGNADTATALETGRDFSISGDAEAAAITFDGTANVGLALTLVNTAVTPGSYGSSSEIPTFTVDSKGRLTAAGSVSVSTGMTVAGDSGSETINLLSETLTIAGGTNLTSSAASDTVTINLDDNISLVSVNASGVVTATSGFVGDLTGNVTGDLTGEVNAAAFDTNASGVVVTGVATATSGFVGDLTGNVTGNVTGDLTGNVTGDLTGEVNAAAFDTNASGVVVTGVTTSTSGFVGDLTGNVTGDLTGNADTATALETSRDFSISGDAEASAISFDGTANVGLALTLVNTAVVAGSYGSATEIPTFTVDSKGRLTAAGTAAVSTGMTVAGDTGSEVIDLLSETLTIAGGTNLTSSAASDTVTINLDDNISLTSVVASGIVTASEFVTGASGQAIGINTNTISGPETITIDPSAVGDNTGLVVIKGDLQIDGTTTTINSTTVTVDDLNILLADGAVNDAAANGGGFTVQSGDGNKTFQFEATGDNFGSSENMNLTSGKVYKINNTEVLSSDTLGSGVVNSSLTSVGTLGQLSVSGVTTSSGGFVGDLTGNADTATALETSRDFSISGDATASAISFDGTANVGLALTLADTGVAAGSYGSSTEIPTFTVDSKGRLTVAGTASVGTALTVAGDSGSEVIDLLSETLTIAGGTNLTSSAASDTVTINLDDNISLVSVNASGVVTATSGFVGDLTGDVTGNLTGDVTGNLNSSGVSTVTNLVIDGYVSAGATTGQQDQVLISVGSGVTWTSITDLLPTARTGLTTTATASQTTFSFEYNVGFLDVFVNGVKLSAAEFTALNGNDIILSEGAFAGDNVEFVSYATLSAGTGEVNSLNDLTDVTLTAPSAGSLLAYDGINWIDTTNLNVGVITATAFVGDGSGLTGAGSTVADDVATDATFYPVFTNITSGTITASKVSTTKLTFNPSTGTLNATNVNTTSDINLKKDISPVENALETVQKLEGVNFTWKDNDKKTIGVIAQQIEEHLPELVDTAEHKSVNYNGLIGVLIEAVKEQQSQIEALRAEIEELKK